MDLGYTHAVGLGVVQGLTEFLPVSSSGHLAITQRWLTLEPDSPAMLLFDVLAHLGTLAAVAIVFFRPACRFADRLRRETRASWSGRRYGWRIAALALAATVPTAVIGLLFKDEFESAFAKPIWISAGLAITGALLLVTVWLPRGGRGWKRFAFWQAVAVGVAQGMAILPGISRSGSTICMASYFGLRRRWAAEFSFLAAVPAILGASILKIKDTFDLGSEALTALAWGPILAGSIVSFVVGIVALMLLLQAVRRAKLHYFTAYCWALALVIFISA